MLEMDVSVILVSYNTKKILFNCLRSIYEHTKDICFEIIVVDNNSNDDSKQMIKENFTEIKLIESKENLGFGKANNEGIKESQGRNILLLNPDTILINNAIKILSDFLDINTNVGVCGGNLFTLDLKPNFSFMPFFPTIPHELNLLSGNVFYRVIVGKSFEFNYTNKPKKVAYVTGANMMIRSTCLHKVGCFDPDFFMYYEETELSFRINKAGYSIFSVPEAHIIHLEGGSFSINFEAQKMSLRSRAIFMKKTQKNIFYQKVSNFIYHLVCFVGLIKARITNKKDSYEFWKNSLKEIKKITVACK